VYLNSQVDF